MGLLNMFEKREPVLQSLPRGTFTVDRNGRVLASTLPQSIPPEMVKEIAREVLKAFATSAQTPLRIREIVVRYANLKLTARELHGGALVFLAPKDFSVHDN
jgi:hypothetical protein